MSRKIILALALALALLTAGTAGAATYYRDRYIPGGPPCMISISGSFVNAVMIKSVRVDEYEYARPSDKFFTRWDYYTRKAMRVSLINGNYYDVFENPDAALADVLKKIENCSK